MKFSHLFVLTLTLYSMLVHVVMASLTCEQDLAVVKEKRLGAIRNQILSKLNMTEAPPNPKKPRTITPDLLDAYNVIKEAFEREARARSTGCVDSNYFARKVSLFTPATPPTRLTPLQPTTDTNTVTDDNTLYGGGVQEGQNLSFSIALPSGSSNEVDYAEIRLRKHCDPKNVMEYTTFCHEQSGDVYGTVELYLHINNGNGMQKIFVTARTLVLNDDKSWEEFVITEALQRCLTNQPFKTQVHLELEIKLDPSRPLPYTLDPYNFFQNSVADLSSTTQLVVFTVNEKDVETAKRRKRQLTRDFCFANFTTNCCVRSLTINFHTDLNWTWVAHPPTYEPNYCSGDCPYLWPAATFHAENLQFVKFLNPAASAEPCCVPAVLLPLTILREDETTGNLILEPLSEMIVDSCICR